MTNRTRIVALTLLVTCLLLGLAQPVQADPPTPADRSTELLQRLQQQAGGSLRVAFHAETGLVRFIGSTPDRPIDNPDSRKRSAGPAEAAISFLEEYGALFGLHSPRDELTVLRSRTNDLGRTTVRWQQVYAGVPVLGAEIIVQLRPDGGVTSVGGEILPGVHLSIIPTVSASAAGQTALNTVAQQHGLPARRLQATQPERWLFSQALLGGPGARVVQLVWRVDVTALDLLPVHELVLVDAHDGRVVLHFNQIDAARERQVYDNANVPGAGLPGTGPVGTEGNRPAGPYPNDAANAYDYTGFTYDFYKTRHNRDSIDNHGMPLTSTVRYCPHPSACPYENAFWNGVQMVFGAGFASADDVTAHELTHGVTRLESGLLYYMQSGAINEALSDVWGELVDLSYTNGYDNDIPVVRWYLGEDVPGGPARFMKNPPEYGHPDQMSSRYYYCAGDDNGGVHRNSGVANKAAYLMVDGGVFNGLSMRGLGIAKAASIWYEVQTNLLTSAANYQDLGDALRQACLVLVGPAQGITADDCLQVQRVVEATEMDQLPIACMTGPQCGYGARTIDLFADGFETGMIAWTSHASLGDDWWQRRHDQPASGVWHVWTRDQKQVSDTYLALTQGVALPDSRAVAGPYMLFQQNWGFEQAEDGTNHDGGVLEYSTDNGASWQDTLSLFMQNGYTGLIDDCCDNPLAGRPAFVGSAPRYVPTRLNLETLRGETVRFRFRVGTDNSPEDAMGWLIDDVRIYVCASATYLPVVSRAGGP